MPVDDRTPIFCYQTIGAMEHLRAHFADAEREDGKRLSLTTAIAVYQVLTELANEHFADGGRAGFKAEQRLIAARAGTGRDTARHYLKALEDAGLVAIRVGDDGEASTYALIDSPRGGGVSDARGCLLSSQGVESQTPPPYIEGRKEEEREGTRANERNGSETRAAAMWPELTVEERAVLTCIVAVAKAKRVRDGWKPESVVAYTRQFGDRAVEFEAEGFRHYYVDGPGENREVKDVVARWRNWLDNAPTAEARQKARRPSGRTVSDPEREQRRAEGRAAIDRLIGGQ